MTTISDKDSWTVRAVIVATVAIALMFALHLTIAVVVGMLVYVCGDRLTQRLRRSMRVRHPALASLGIMLVVLVGLTVAAQEMISIALAGAQYQSLVDQIASELDRLQGSLPQWLASLVPSSLDEARAEAVSWLRGHAAQVRSFGKESLRILAHVVVGLVIGGLAVVQVSRDGAANASTPWLRALGERFALFEQCFSTVVFAQLRIALINTVLTGLYLLVVLPLLGVRLPFASTLLVVTFVTGLVPLVGNLGSNADIVVLSATQGIWIAVLSLVFLALVHKLEYVLNAMIVGKRIHTRAFELLTAMVVLEALLGIAGVVMAPILYAYAKAELRSAGWLPTV